VEDASHVNMNVDFSMKKCEFSKKKKTKCITKLTNSLCNLNNKSEAHI
jgi:hypothetical protein